MAQGHEGHVYVMIYCFFRKLGSRASLAWKYGCVQSKAIPTSLPPLAKFYKLFRFQVSTISSNSTIN